MYAIGDSQEESKRMLTDNQETSSSIQLDKKRSFSQQSALSLGEKIQQKVSTPPAAGINISFHLKQCTVFHNKFGCYSIELKYGSQSRRSPTINILKEKINLNVIIKLTDSEYNGEEILISLYNQTLSKSKQTDILLSKQSLKLSQFKENAQKAQDDQMITFAQGAQMKAEIKFSLSVEGLEEQYQIAMQKRNFGDLLRKWMKDIFLPKIYAKYLLDQQKAEDELKKKKLKEEQEELRLKKMKEEEEKKKKKAQEEEEKKLKKAQEEEEKKQKKAEQEAEKKKKHQEQEEKARQEVQKKQEELMKQRQEKEKERLAWEELKRQQEEIVKKQKEEQLTKEKEELKLYESEQFEEDIKENTKKKQKKKAEDEIEEELPEEGKENDFKLQVKINKGNSQVVFKSTMPKKRNSLIQEEGIVILSQGGVPPQLTRTSSISKQGRRSSGGRNFMGLLKQWMMTFLKKIIANINFDNKLDICGSSFLIFGDETFPFVIRFYPVSLKLVKYPLPKSLAMYRYSQAVGIPNGQVIICGGVNSKLNNILPFASLYDPFLNKAFPLPSMNQARYTHSATCFRDYVYVIGGRSYGSGESSILSSFERFSLKKKTWEKLQKLPDGRCTTSLIGLPSSKQHLFLVGGFSPRGRLNTIERYNITDDSWTTLAIKLPSELEAGISIPSEDGKSFYYLFGRGNKDRNEEVLEIKVPFGAEQQEYQIQSISKIKSTRVLPAFFIEEESQKLFVFGGEDYNWQHFSLPSFQYIASDKDMGQKSEELFPSDIKMFCFAFSKQENPKKPPGANIKETFYSHFISIDNEGGVKQIKTGKDISLTELKIPTIGRPIINYSYSLIDSNFLFIFGGEYFQIKGSVQVARFSKECFIFSLNNGNLVRRKPSLTAKKNSTVYVKKQAIYSFGGEKIISEGNSEITALSERYLIQHNRWERISSLPSAAQNCKSFEFNYVLYILGGITAGRTFNSQVFEYNLQFDFYLSSQKRIPIEFKHAVQIYAKTTKQPTPFLLLFSASFKQQGVFSLIDGSFVKFDILPTYSDEEKKQMRVCQENEYISFEFSNKIDIYRAFVPDQQFYSSIPISGIEFQQFKEVQHNANSSATKSQSKNLFFTRFVTKSMESYNFIEETQNNQSLKLKDDQDNKKQQKKNQNDLFALFEDNQGELKLVRQEIVTGFEEISNLSSKDKSDKIKVPYKCASTYIPEGNKMILSGGIEGTKQSAVASIIEVDLNSNKLNILGEMITPRYYHTQVQQGEWIYMIGGCGNIFNGSKNQINSSFSRLQQIAAAKNANTQAVIEIQSQLASKKSSIGSMSTSSKRQSLVTEPKPRNNSGSSSSLANILGGQQQYFLGKTNDYDDDDDDGITSFNDRSSFCEDSMLKRRESGNIPLKHNEEIKKKKVSSIVLKKVDRINLRTLEIESVSDLPFAVKNSSSCSIQNSIYLFGGKDNQNCVLDLIQKYETNLNTWSVLQFKMNQPLHSLNCFSIGFSSVIIFGGVNQVGKSNKEIQVVDIKGGNINKITSLLSFDQSSCKIAFSNDKIYAYEKNRIQDLSPSGNLNSFFSSEVSPIATLDGLQNQEQFFGIFSASQPIQSEMPKKSIDSLFMFSSEKSKSIIQFDMRQMRTKQIEVPKNMSLISSSSACFQDETNIIVISGGIDMQNGGVVSNQIQLFKTTPSSVIKYSLILPRFLHASACLGQRVIFIGGKSLSTSNDSIMKSPSFLSTPHTQRSLSQSNIMDDKSFQQQLQGNGSINLSGSSKFNCTADCESFNVYSLENQSIAPLNIPRSNIQAIVLFDHIYVFGGFGGDKRLRSIEKYSSSRNCWTILDCCLAYDLENYSLCKISSQEVMIVGGKENGQISQRIFLFHAQFQTITQFSQKLPYELPAFKCGLYGEQLFIFGNQQNQPTAVALNLRNGFDDSKIPPFQQLAQLDFSWSSVLAKQ